MAEEIDPDLALRLSDAVKIAFPFGGMTVAGLRREAKPGRLVIRDIAGKHLNPCQESDAGENKVRAGPLHLKITRRCFLPSTTQNAGTKQ
jgi:hypothetical protein